MSNTLQETLGIWNNESCVQCGACCYDYNHNSLCRYQEIRQGKSYCKRHEDPKRDILCRTWFCSFLRDKSILSLPSRVSDSLTERLVLIAIDLGTAPITS